VRGHDAYSASCAGFTRASIHLRKSLSKMMDCRVKPGMTPYANNSRREIRLAPFER
jgi:hypothetical protein